MHFAWSHNFKASSVTIREEAVYEKGNAMGLVCI